MQLILCCHCRMMTKKMMISLVWQVMADPKFIISLCDTSMAHWWLLNLHGFSVETAQKSLEELGGEALFLYVTVTMLTWQVNNMDSCLHRYVLLCGIYQSPCLVKKLHHTFWFQKFTHKDIYDQTTYWQNTQFYDVWNFGVIYITSGVICINWMQISFISRSG